MKRVLVTAAIVLLTLGVVTAHQGAGASGANATGAVVQALMDLENQWAKASKASNGDAIAPLLFEDFVALDSDGSMHGKSDLVARTKKEKWVTNEIGDLKVIVHGDSAVVTGSWTGNGTDDAGKPVNTRERWADTWVKMANGRWQCVVSASTSIK